MKPSDLDDDGQWDNSEEDAIFGANVSTTSYTRLYYVLKSILLDPEHTPPRVAFKDDVAFTKVATDDEFFFVIPKLDTYEFDNYDGFSTSLAVGPFGPNYIYATTNYLISSSFSISKITHYTYTIDSFVRYCINGLYGRRVVPAPDGKIYLVAINIW